MVRDQDEYRCSLPDMGSSSADRISRSVFRRRVYFSLYAARPDFAVTVRRDYGKWWDAKTVDHLLEGLRQAGLEIPDTDSKPAPSDAHAGC
jgi:hypothetical protein